MTDLITTWPFEPFTLAAGAEVCHTYRSAFGPLSANPRCNTRFALTGAPGQPNLRAAYYIASSPRGALWEVILRSVRPNAHNQVSVAQALYAGRSLARLRARRAIPRLVRVDRPHRLRLVEQDSPGDIAWDVACTHAVHPISQGLAAAANTFLAEHGMEHSGLGWRSKQFPDDIVHVLYAPPFDPNDWEVLEEVDLTSAAGLALIRDAITAAGFHWLELPDDAPSIAEVPEA